MSQLGGFTEAPSSGPERVNIATLGNSNSNGDSHNTSSTTDSSSAPPPPPPPPPPPNNNNSNSNNNNNTSTSAGSNNSSNIGSNRNIVSQQVVRGNGSNTIPSWGGMTIGNNVLSPTRNYYPTYPSAEPFTAVSPLRHLYPNMYPTNQQQLQQQQQMQQQQQGSSMAGGQGKPARLGETNPTTDDIAASIVNTNNVGGSNPPINNNNHNKDNINNVSKTTEQNVAASSSSNNAGAGADTGTGTGTNINTNTNVNTGINNPNPSVPTNSSSTTTTTGSYPYYNNHYQPVAPYHHQYPYPNQHPHQAFSQFSQLHPQNYSNPTTTHHQPLSPTPYNYLQPNPIFPQNMNGGDSLKNNNILQSNGNDNTSNNNVQSDILQETTRNANTTSNGASTMNNNNASSTTNSTNSNNNNSKGDATNQNPHPGSSSKNPNVIDLTVSPPPHTKPPSNGNNTIQPQGTNTNTVMGLNTSNAQPTIEQTQPPSNMNAISNNQNWTNNNNNNVGLYTSSQQQQQKQQQHHNFPTSPKIAHPGTTGASNTYIITSKRPASKHPGSPGFYVDKQQQQQPPPQQYQQQYQYEYQYPQHQQYQHTNYGYMTTKPNGNTSHPSYPLHLHPPLQPLVPNTNSNIVNQPPSFVGNSTNTHNNSHSNFAGASAHFQWQLLQKKQVLQQQQQQHQQQQLQQHSQALIQPQQQSKLQQYQPQQQQRQQQRQQQQQPPEQDENDIDVESVMQFATVTALKKKNESTSLYDIASVSFVTCLSPALKIIAKNIEIIRLLIISKSESNQSELWPGVSVGGAAIQCKYCKESKRFVLNSMSEIESIIITLGLDHLGSSHKTPEKVKSQINAALSELKLHSTERRLRSEIRVFSQHLIQNMVQNKIVTRDIPMVRSKIPIENVKGKTNKNLKRKMTNSKAVYVQEVSPFKPKKRIIGARKSKAFDVGEVSPMW